MEWAELSPAARDIGPKRNIFGEVDFKCVDAQHYGL